MDELAIRSLIIIMVVIIGVIGSILLLAQFLQSQNR